METEQTTIRINPNTKSELDFFRQYKNESYDELVRKLIHLVKTCEKEPKLSQKTILEIKEARERIKKGEFYTESEAKKILGL
ncbi:hypothetical protein J4474_01075 [Candidatus Pacearchaeota archaeon]|nr:hypothetical protein [Candidatus Pacearchaeota archaeon]